MPHWKKPLTRELLLRNRAERVISTLDQAGGFLLANFRGVTHSEPLERALRLLAEAVETGDAEDIEAFTDQLELLLTDLRIM